MFSNGTDACTNSLRYFIALQTSISTRHSILYMCNENYCTYFRQWTMKMRLVMSFTSLNCHCLINLQRLLYDLDIQVFKIEHTFE